MGCSLVVHYWTDLQSVHGFRWYDDTSMYAYSLANAYSAEREVPASACTRSVAGFALSRKNLTFAIGWFQGRIAGIFV